MTKIVAVIAALVTPVAIASGCAGQGTNNSSSTTSGTSASSAKTLTTQLNTADGKHVADATVDFTSGYATVTVETAEAGILSPGFHGVHIHAVGKCEGDFTSAGDHFQASGHTGQPASGDLPPLLVRSDGSGKLVATSDGFTEDQLKGSDGSSIVLHQSADMGTEGASASEQRLACGVLSPASSTSTSISTSTSVSTVTTAAPTVPPATVTETTSSTAPTSTTTTSSAAPSTSTSTVTVIQPPTIPPITIPGG